MEVLILLLLVGGIVAVAYRWPDVEKRIWPDRAAGKSAEAPASEQAAETPPAEHVATPEPSDSGGKGVMRTRPVKRDPEVDPVATSSRPAEPVTEVPEPVTPTDPKPAEPPKEQPGGFVSGAPARPSEPAFVDATSGSENLQDLAEQIDQAYRDRDYETAEQAALKLLAKDPKNHKYMTRLGQVYQELGQLEDAREAFEEAKKLDPKNFFVLNRLTEVERLLSDKGGRTKSKR